MLLSIEIKALCVAFRSVWRVEGDCDWSCQPGLCTRVLCAYLLAHARTGVALICGLSSQLSSSVEVDVSVAFQPKTITSTNGVVYSCFIGAPPKAVTNTVIIGASLLVEAKRVNFRSSWKQAETRSNALCNTLRHTQTRASGS